MDIIELIAYLRILLIAASWFFIEEQPAFFLLIFYIADITGMIDKLFFKSDKNTELQKQLRTVADMISTTVLTFSVVRASMNWANTEEGKEDTGNLGMLTFCYGLIFLIDFVSKWFKQYSIYLAGERTEVVSS